MYFSEYPTHIQCSNHTTHEEISCRETGDMAELMAGLWTPWVPSMCPQKKPRMLQNWWCSKGEELEVGTLEAASSWVSSWIFCCCWISSSWTAAKVVCNWVTAREKAEELNWDTSTDPHSPTPFLLSSYKDASIPTIFNLSMPACSL